MLFFLLMPTIVGILTFMSRKNFMLNWVEHEKSFITSGPVFTSGLVLEYYWMSFRCILLTCVVFLHINSAFQQTVIRWYVRLRLNWVCTFAYDPKTHFQSNKVKDIKMYASIYNSTNPKFGSANFGAWSHCFCKCLLISHQAFVFLL